MESNDREFLVAKIDGISKGLRMGMAEIYSQLISFDKQNIDEEKPSFAYTFLEQQASELGQTFGEFMEEQTSALKEYSEYLDAINRVYEISDEYGYKEDE